ncbi:MAG: ATP synthase subunit I [Pyrinomonadaceae bacterium]|nr:ATP synthase subunit I [Acidobacteriota bacterium]
MGKNAGSGRLEDSADGEALERRLFRGMWVSIVLAALVSVPLFPWRVTTGLLLGGVLSLFNHHWLRTALAAAFGRAAAGGRPRIRAARYVLRYFVVAAVVWAAYALDLVSLPATIVGLCAFVPALLIEALTQFYFAIVYREDT